MSKRLRLFDTQTARKPNLYPWTADFILDMRKGHWFVENFDFTADIHDFKVNMVDASRELVTRAMSAIGQIEIGVKTFWAKLGENLPHPSLYDLGITMAQVEVIHNDAYEALLVQLGLEDIYEKNLELDVVKGRVAYLKKYAQKFSHDKREQFIYSLILFTLFIEGVSLFSQFYIIYWFYKAKNQLKVIANQISYTAMEEAAHLNIGTKLVNELRKEYPELFTEELYNRVNEEARVAFEAESKMIDWIVGDFEEEGLSAPVLKEYVKNRINKCLNGIGMDSIYEVDRSLVSQTEWSDVVFFGQTKTDFFNQKPTDYANTKYSANSIF